MRIENTWQEIREHSFIQNHSRSFRFPAPWRCFFSSVHLTHLLQGSGQRTGMAIAEAWFCAQWPIYFVVFEVCVWIIVRLEDQNIAHYKLSSGAFPLSSVVRLGSARLVTARLSSGRFAFPLQFSTALEWAGLFTCCYIRAASTAVTSS